MLMPVPILTLIHEALRLLHSQRTWPGLEGLEVAAMGVIVTARSGYDLGYAWKNQGQGGGKPAAKTPDGYHIDAVQGGEPPGR